MHDHTLLPFISTRFSTVVFYIYSNKYRPTSCTSPARQIALAFHQNAWTEIKIIHTFAPYRQNHKSYIARRIRKYTHFLHQINHCLFLIARTWHRNGHGCLMYQISLSNPTQNTVNRTILTLYTLFLRVLLKIWTHNCHYYLFSSEITKYFFFHVHHV